MAEAPQDQGEGTGTERGATSFDYLETIPSWREFHLQRHHGDYHNKLMMIAHEIRQKGEGTGALPGERHEMCVAYDRVKVPPTGWKCCKCDEAENLWLNLTDGSILCGRRNWDGTGGSDHALEHYQETNYPLAVNLGTIPPDSQGADVFSYPEDDTVEDPLLAEHLAHFEIEFPLLRKTERTTAQRELDQNTAIDGDIIPEKGKELDPPLGPGFTGLADLGNSCFENVKLDDPFKQAPGDPTLDLDMQQ